MDRASETRFTLIGGGLAGALLAVQLGQAGRRVELIERRGDPAGAALTGGRSINLAISVRGIHALQQVGLADEIMRMAVPMRGRMIHPRVGPLHFQPYDRDPARCIHSISRGALNAALLRAAQGLASVRVEFDWACREVDLERPAAILRHTQRDEERRVESDVLIGIDGAWSAVRRSMQRLERFDFSQHFLGHGYKELTIPPLAGGGFALEPNALHIWPRRSYMMIALPNPDGSFTCTLFLPFEGPASFAALRTPEDVRRWFGEEFPDAVPHMPTLLADFDRNPIGSMVTIRCAPWSHRGRIALVGDAAHAVVPFYGQGMNASFEDVGVLCDCLADCGGDWGAALREYERLRRPNADALADLALRNFIEMRDRTASRAFRAYKRLDRALHGALPGLYTPLYTMVSFSRTPYAEAESRAARQDRVLGAGAALLVAAVLAMVLWLSGWGAAWQAAIAGAGLVGLAWIAVTPLREREREELRAIGVRRP